MVYLDVDLRSLRNPREQEVILAGIVSVHSITVCRAIVIIAKHLFRAGFDLLVLA